MQATVHGAVVSNAIVKDAERFWALCAYLAIERDAAGNAYLTLNTPPFRDEPRVADPIELLDQIVAKMHESSR